VKKTGLVVVVLVSTGWACVQQPVARPCNERDVGTDPPASVRFVGLNEQEVPFDSWSCPNLNADNFGDPQDFRVFSIDGTVTVFVVTDPANVASVIGDPAVGNPADLPTDVIDPGQIRIAVPDPIIEWTIRLRIATPTERVAHYEVTLAPPG
jgi:hypothetical protein